MLAEIAISSSIYHLPFSRGHSSVGRAPALQAGSQGFESPCLQNLKIVSAIGVSPEKFSGQKVPESEIRFGEDCFGKLPKPAGWQPALPRKIRVDPRNPRSSARKKCRMSTWGWHPAICRCAARRLGTIKELPDTLLTRPYLSR
jgi:hypothetical protein